MNRPIILRSLAIGGAVTHDRRHSPVSPDPRVAGGATVLEPRPVGVRHEGGSDEEHGGPSRGHQTTSTPPSRSTSFQRRPSTSPRRIPIVAISSQTGP
jgi:hypothetical protein